MEWNKKIPVSEIQEKVTPGIVKFAEEFGEYLGCDEKEGPRNNVVKAKLTTSQLRKFFGEVKRQQMIGYDATEFAMLKPKLAYAVARADKKSKIKEFYEVMSHAIDQVKDKVMFKNFITIFEAIVAYHKQAEERNKK